MTYIYENIEKLFYLLSLKNSNYKEKMKLEIINLLQDIRNMKNITFETGLILFIVGEYIHTFNDKGILEEHKEEINNLLKKYDLKFYREEENVVYGAQKKVYTSNLGAIYGGLKSINNYLKRDDISLNIRDIRKYTFENVIDGGTLSNANKNKEVTFDILLACNPFGLFEPEDLILVEAVKVLLEKSRETDKTIELLLLSNYYAEQGSYNLSKELMKKAKAIGLQDKCSEYLYDIIYYKLKSKSQLQDYIIIHNPLGNNNIYDPGYNERFPKKVKSTDNVTLKALTWPISQSMDVYAKVMVNGTETVYKGIFVEHPEKHFVWDIGKFTPLDKVRYKLYFTLDNGKEVSTEYFDFEVLEEVKIQSVNEVRLYGNILELQCEDNKDDSFKIGIELDSNRDICLFTDDNIINNSESANPQIDLSEQPNYYSVKWGNSSLLIYKKPFNIIYKTKEDFIFNSFSQWVDSKGNIEFTQMSITKEKDELFYGFGERYNALNQAGNSPDVFVYNQYKNQGLKTYIPIPFYISSKNYGLFVDNSHYTKLDMGETNEETIKVLCESGDIKFRVFSGTVSEVISKYTNITGKPKMIPKWALGPWMSSNNWDSQEEVLKQLELTIKHKIPSTVLVVEAWSDEVTFYAFNDAKYDEKPSDQSYSYEDYRYPEWGRWPDPKAMVERLHDEGLKCILWQIPILKEMSTINHIQKDLDEVHAIDQGYVIQNEDGSPYRLPEGWFKDSLLLDFSNQDATKWWFDKRRYLVEDLKIDGFKTDGGEFIFGQNLKFSDGRTGSEMRNSYPNDYVSAYYNFINTTNPNGGITFSRAGFTGAQNFPAHWAGDERSNFDAFKRSIYAGLSSGLSGISLWGWDLGGFSGEIPTAELFIRATQMATFCPIMQYHAESKAELNQDRTPWNIAERTGDIRALEYYRYYANLRMNLIPYIYFEALKSSRSGLPIMRAMIIDYFEDENTHLLDTQYMFGSSLLIAPVIEEGKTERSIYLPDGNWYELFTGDCYTGGKGIKVTANLDQIPVYIRDNSVIPLNLGEELKLGSHIGNELTSYKNLTFLIEGNPVSYEFADDLDNTFNITKKNNILSISTNYKTSFWLLTKEEELVINGQLTTYTDKMDKRFLFEVTL